MAVFTIVFGIFHHIILLFLLPIFSVNLVLHFKNKNYIDYFISAVSQLDIALKTAQKLLQEEEIKAAFPDATFIDEVNKIAFKTKFIAFQKHLANDATAVFWYLFELLKVVFNIEAIIFYSFIAAISKKNTSIDALFRFIGIIDSAISTVSVKASGKTCKPTFCSGKQLTIEDMRHPILKDCVPNSIALDKKSLLLTGSNMAGKTTFIRAVAVNTVLAQTLNIAFAKRFEIPFFKLYSSIRISDSLLDNTSYYLQEVLIIKKLIEASQSTEPCFFILDEIFKGTNTIERISGGKAILSYLNTSKHFVFVATHDIELTVLLEKEKYDLYHFSEHIVNNELYFDHKLKKGRLTSHNAIKILDLYDYPDSIIADAEATKKNFN